MSTSPLPIGSTVYFVTEAIPGMPFVYSGTLVEVPRASCYVVNTGRHNAYTTAVYRTEAEATEVADSRRKVFTVAQMCEVMR